MKFVILSVFCFIVICLTIIITFRKSNDDKSCSDVLGIRGLNFYFGNSERTVVVLSNGYVCMEIVGGQIMYLYADYQGLGKYDLNDSNLVNLLEGGISLTKDYSTRLKSSTPVQVLKSDSSSLRIKIPNIGDDCVKEDWIIELEAFSRFYQHTVENVRICRNLDQAVVYRRSWSFTPTSLYSWFGGSKLLNEENESVVQMKNASIGKTHFSTNQKMIRFYSLGGSGERDSKVGNRCVDVSALDGFIEPGIVLKSGPKLSGFDQHLSCGNECRFKANDSWSHENKTVFFKRGPPLDELNAIGSTTKKVYRVHVNSLDFPAGGEGLRFDTKENLPQNDLHAFLMGAYGSPSGAFRTHINAIVPGQAIGQMATTIGFPNYGYQDNYNFFDPDDYIATAAVLWTNDPFLQRQVRFVLERSGSFLKKDTGQLPHHFSNATPVYQALSGEVQTGPNVFWILSCFNYAKSSQDFEWLSDYMPTLRFASEFLFSLINHDIKLASVPGSLMIDTFLRSNYTSDTNAQLVEFFREFADAEEAIGNHTGAKKLRDLSIDIANSINKYLWDHDHFITQWNFPENTTRDFVDYDANFIACAHGIPSLDRVRKIVERIDKRGKCPHTASYVSEKYYGLNETKSGNIGDSDCAMGRIAWFDALTRKRLNDQKSFDERILGLLQRTLLGATWMHERLHCDGTQDFGRTGYYFEYPSIVSMLIRNVKYGIDIGLDKIKIQPFGPTNFTYNINELLVKYEPANIVVFSFQKLEGTNPKQFSIYHLLASTRYQIFLPGNKSSKPWTRTTDKDGFLHFKVPIEDFGGKFNIILKPIKQTIS